MTVQFFFLHPVLRSCRRQELELLLDKSWKAYYRISLPGSPRLLCKWNWFPVFVFCVFGLPARPAAGFLFSRASKDNELQMVSKLLCLNIFLDNKTGPLLGLKFILDMYLNLPTPCHLSLSSKQSMVVKIARVASSRICLLKSLKCQLMATVSTTFEEKNHCFYWVPFKWTICCRK